MLSIVSRIAGLPTTGEAKFVLHVFPIADLVPVLPHSATPKEKATLACAMVASFRWVCENQSWGEGRRSADACDVNSPLDGGNSRPLLVQET
jgi:hypothetical protein